MKDQWYAKDNKIYQENVVSSSLLYLFILFI